MDRSVVLKIPDMDYLASMTPTAWSTFFAERSPTDVLAKVVADLMRAALETPGLWVWYRKQNVRNVFDSIVHSAVQPVPYKAMACTWITLLVN